ncbi:malonyl-CoA-[acp] transacylase [Campylobacter blaseri]|nr:malonyl-CoA-[acp] transacylase [Campylobacter blaseri]
MGKEIYENFTQPREILNEASKQCNIDFKDLLFEKNEKLSISEFTQPAIVLNSFMCFLALEENLSVKPSFTLGHSLGEFSALGVSGAFDLIDTVCLVNKRGKFMQEACIDKNASMMVILGLADDKVEEICSTAREYKNAEVWPANYNSDGQIVLAGNRDDLENLENTFKEEGAKRVMLLNMSVASHCPMLESASRLLSNELEPLLKDSFNPVISNVIAQSYNTKQEAMQLLRSQLVKPVLYKQSIQNIDDEVDCYIEFGSSILKGINRKITKKPTYSITDLKSLDEFMEFAKDNN